MAKAKGKKGKGKGKAKKVGMPIELLEKNARKLGRVLAARHSDYSVVKD